MLLQRLITGPTDATAAAVARTSLVPRYMPRLAHRLDLMKISVRAASGESDDVRRLNNITKIYSRHLQLAHIYSISLAN